MRYVTRGFGLVLALALAALVMGALAGCAAAGKVGEAVEASPLASMIVITQGVKHYVKGHPERAARVTATAHEFAAIDADEAVTLALLEERLRARIPWERMTPLEQMQAQEVLRAIVEPVRARVGEGILSPEERVTIRQVATWAALAADEHR